MKRLFFLWLMSTLCMLSASAIHSMNEKAKRFTISGYVTDKASGETLLGADIYSVLHQTGGATNEFGFYTITLPEGSCTLRCSYVGYQSQEKEITLSCDTIINFQLTAGTMLNEVVITSERGDSGLRSTNMGAFDISTKQILATPSVLGEADVIKSLQLLPGVQAGTEGFSGIYVRGGGMDENLIMLDGSPIYNADHLMGIFSVFVPEAVKNVTFFKSSFPSRFGGRLSSIVDVRTKDGNMNEGHGTFSLGLLSSKLHLEGPLKKGRTSYSISARGTYTGLAKLIYPKMNESYYFYDLNAKINHKISESDRIWVNLYNGLDRFDYNDTYDITSSKDKFTSKEENSLEWGNTILAGRWTHIFSGQLFGNMTAAYNRYHMLMHDYEKEYRGDEVFDYFDSRYRSGIRDFSMRLDMDYTPVPSHVVKFGTEVIHHNFDPETMTSRTNNGDDGKDEKVEFNNKNDKNLSGTELSAYVEDNIDFGSLSLSLGSRLAMFHTEGKSYLSFQPRVSARLRLSDVWSLKTAYAEMAQYVHLLSSTQLTLPTDLWVPITKDIKPARSRQISLGSYWQMARGWELSVETYYKKLYNVLEYKDGMSVIGISTGWDDKVEMGEGRSYGTEFFLSKKTGRLTGHIAYTLSKTDRQFKDGTINNGRRFLYKYDRRHNFNIMASYAISPRTDVNLSWSYLSGGMISVPERMTLIGGYTVGYISERNNYRLPASHHLNAGINFHKALKRGGERVWTISIYNVYNAMNPNICYTEADWDAESEKHKVKLKKITILPIIPAITYTYKF